MSKAVSRVGRARRIGEGDSTIAGIGCRALCRRLDRLLATVRELQVAFVGRDRSSGSVHRDLLSRDDVLGGVWYPDYGRDAVLAGDHGTVRHGSSHLHYEATGREEERRPARVG